MINWIINLLFHIYNRLKYFILDKCWDFQYTKYYWLLRRKFDISKFIFSKTLYKDSFLNENTVSFKSYIASIKFFKGYFWSTVRVPVCILINFVLIITLINLKYEYFTINKILDFFKGIIKDTETLLIAMMSSSIVLIGLYFASITNTFKQKYQLSLKKLIARDPLGRSYMYSLILVCIFCLLSWFLKEGMATFILTLILCFFFSFLLVIFPKVSTNSFFIFQPNFMAHMIYKDVLSFLKMIQNKGFYSIFFNSIHFHDYVKRQIKEKLNIFEDILDVFFQKGQFLRYEIEKVFYWIFSIQTAFNKSRYLTDENNGFYDINKSCSELDEVWEESAYRNYYWIDDKVLDLFLNTLEKLKKEKNISEIIDLISLFVNSFPKNLGYSWDILYFHKIFPKIKEAFKNIVFDRSFDLSDRINISRYLATINFSVSCESHKKVKDIFKNISYDIDQISKALLKKKILVNDFFIKPFCVNLSKKLKAEFESSGKITPKWFLTQSIAQKYSEKTLEIYKLNFENKKGLLDDFQARPTSDKNENFENSCIYYNILKTRIQSLSYMVNFKTDWIQLTKNLKENEKISDLKIPVMTKEYFKKEIDNELFNCYTKISEILTHLYKPSSQEDLKFFNEAYDTVREKAVSLLVKSESQYHVSFKKCFENLFSASILIKDNLFKKTGRFEPVNFIKNMESVESMVFLSSYILLSSKVCKKPDLINDHIDLWKKVFSKLGEGDLSKGIKVFLKYLSLYKNSSQEIRYESIWEEQFREFLIKKGYKTKNPYYDSLRLSSEGQILQKSDEKKASCKYLEFALKNYSDSFLMKDLFIIYILEEETFQVEKDIKQKYEKNMNLYRKYKIYIESLKK